MSINTPGQSQPYTQPLYWNGQQIDHFHDDKVDEGDGEPVLQYGSLNFDGQLSSVDYNGGIYDGDAYKFKNDSITSMGYTQVFMTFGWIKKYIDVPENATNIEINNMFGFWENKDDDTYSRQSYTGKAHTVNNVDGILVNLVPSTNVSSGKKSWNIFMPSAIKYMAPLDGSGAIPVD